jgi:hypothetical protein
MLRAPPHVASGVRSVVACGEKAVVVRLTMSDVSHHRQAYGLLVQSLLPKQSGQRGRSI